MAEKAPQKRLALDTNVLLDRAAGESFAQSFVDGFQARGFDLRIPPTVQAELGFLAFSCSGEKKRLATVALQSMIAWKITPILLSDVEEDYRTNFVTFAHDRGVIPAREEHDALILAEVSIAKFNALVTSDATLLEADRTELKRAFRDAGLDPVEIVHPAKLLKALR
jgi:predicted nucleic acid-binding protein